jgi:transposase
MGFPFFHFSGSLSAGGEGWATLTRWIFANGYPATSLPGIHDGQRRGRLSTVPAQQYGWRPSIATGVPVAPKRQGRAPGPAGKLRPHIAFLVEIVRAEPDITLKELAGALEETHGVSGQLSSIHRALVRSGLFYKKKPDPLPGRVLRSNVPRGAQERARADIRLARFTWTVRRQPFMRQRAQRLVFIPSH